MTPRSGKHERLKVLDHGYVQLVDLLGSDELIIESARMSTGKGFLGWGVARICTHCDLRVPWFDKLNDAQLHCDPRRTDGTAGHVWKRHEGDEHLLEFLYKHRHMTPFEVPRLLIEVKAPLFIFREWHRHRIWVYNELSARYTQMPNEHYVPSEDRFIPKQHTDNKQAGGQQTREPQQSSTQRQQLVALEQLRVYEQYEEMLSDGVPREVARLNTPVSRYSVMRAGVSLRGALDFLVLRDHSAAQWEMQQYGQAFDQIVKACFPRTHALYEEYTKHAVTFSRAEMSAMRHMLNPDMLSDTDAEKSVWKKVFP